MSVVIYYKHIPAYYSVSHGLCNPLTPNPFVWNIIHNLIDIWFRFQCERINATDYATPSNVRKRKQLWVECSQQFF